MVLLARSAFYPGRRWPAIQRRVLNSFGKEDVLIDIVHDKCVSCEFILAPIVPESMLITTFSTNNRANTYQPVRRGLALPLDTADFSLSR